MSKQKLILIAGSTASVKFRPDEDISIAVWAEKEKNKRFTTSATATAEGLIVLKCLQSIKFNGFEKRHFISYQPEDAHLIGQYMHDIMMYLKQNDILKNIATSDSISVKDWNAMVSIVHEKLKEKNKKKTCEGKCTCNDKSNNLESLIKNQKPRISLGKDLEERLATYNDEIVKGIISNIKHTLDKVDENPAWWTEDKLNAASMLGMSIADVPEEVICDNEEYREAYHRLVNAVAKIHLNIRKDAEAKKIEGDVKLLLDILANRLELFLPDEINLCAETGRASNKFEDASITKMVQDLKEEVIKSNNIEASKILELLNIVPKFIEGYIHTYDIRSTNNMQVSDFVTKVARYMVGIK